ncbi:MAG: hypothetical protein ACYS8L_09845 [Planctomycetota bacterium]
MRDSGKRFLRARPASAYIDPGTGGAVFSALAPLIAMIGIMVVAVVGFGRTYVRLVAGFLWRRRVWVAVALVLIAAGTVAALALR